MDAVRGRGREVAFLAFAIVVAATSLTGTLWVFLGDSSEGRRGKGSLEAAIARDFTPPKSYDVASLTRERPLRCGVRDVQCVRRYMASITDEYGPRAAVALVSHWKKDGRISPSLDEHNLAHVIGRKTAQRFGANVEGFNLCPIAFNYGCPHGFFEYVLGRAGTPKEAAGLICEAQNDSSIATAAFSCYHGVGHGVMMAQAYDLDRSLTTCNTLGNTTAHVGCWQGVFMENVNAAVQNQARKGLFTPTHPLAPCDRVAERYQQQCFINHAGWLMKVARNDIGRATRFCLAAPRSQVSTCMQSIGLMVTNPVWQRNLSDDFGRRSFADVAWGLCTRFPDGRERDCVLAGVDNLGNFDRLKVDRASSFCSLVARGLRVECFRRIGVNVARQSKDRALVRASCKSLPAGQVTECLVGAGLGRTA